ncbi:MAG: adenosine deaminase, partial [Pseudomonadota bacterium]
MQKTIASLMVSATLAACALPHAAHAATAASNEEITKRHFAALVAGSEPKLAELTMFFTMMPKGGDLHHHYSGAIYAEQYLEWVDHQHYCVKRANYMIETDQAA